MLFSELTMCRPYCTFWYLFSGIKVLLTFLRIPRSVICLHSNSLLRVAVGSLFLCFAGWEGLCLYIYIYKDKYIIACRLQFCRWNPSPAHNQACFAAVSECTVLDSVSCCGLEMEIMMCAVKQSKMRRENESSAQGKCECGQHQNGKKTTFIYQFLSLLSRRV